MQLPDGRRNKVTGLVKLPSDLLGRKLVEVASEVQGVDGNDLSAAPLPVVPGATDGGKEEWGKALSRQQPPRRAGSETSAGLIHYKPTEQCLYVSANQEVQGTRIVEYQALSSKTKR